MGKRVSTDFLAGGGELGGLIRAHDWAATPLGRSEDWPQSLRSALSICLHSSFPTAIYWGPKLTLLYNDAWAPIPAERHPWALGRPGAEVWPDIWHVVGPQFEQVMATGEGFSTFDQMLPMTRGGAAGETYWNYSFTPIRGEDGAVVGVFNQGHETTERVLGERRARFLLDLSDTLRSLTDAGAIIRAAQSALGAHLAANRVGYGEVDATARYFTTVDNWTDGSVGAYEGVHDLAAFGPAIHGALKAGEPLLVPDVGADPRTNFPDSLAAFDALETRAAITASMVKDGRMRAALYAHARHPQPWTEADAALVSEVAERTWSAAERARSEQALRQLNETLEERIAEALAERNLLADLVEGAEAFVQVADSDYRLIATNEAANREFERLFGVRPAIGDNVLALLDDQPEGREIVRAVWARALAGEAFTQVGEVSGAFYEMRFSPLLDAEGRQIGAYQFSYDVTDRIRDQQRLAEAEEALRQSQKMEAIGQLTGCVAHDFNNLLTPIIGSLDLLQRKRLGGEREQRLVAGALQSAERAKTLVQRLLAFARRQPLQPVAVDVARLVRGMAELVASTTGPQINVTVLAPDDTPPARADANQLEMALLNLSVNARDAMPDGGDLRITAGGRDRGPRAPERPQAGGLCAHFRSRYGRRDGRADPGSSGGAVLLHQGGRPRHGPWSFHGARPRLAARWGADDPEPPGLGTNIELWLPQSPEAAEEAQPLPAAELDSTPRGSALLVDDEELVRLSAADMLSDLGYRVTEADSAEAALGRLEAGERYDLLVTDHLMPGMDGATLAREAQARWPWMAVLVVSGYAENEGVDPDLPRLNKPFRKDELAAKLAAG